MKILSLYYKFQSTYEVKINFKKTHQNILFLNVKGSVRENERGFRLNAIKKRF